MKVFQMRLMVNKYQYFLTDPISDYTKLYMNGAPIGDLWVPPKVYVQYPHRPRGNFFQPNESVLIADEKAAHVLRSHLSFAGELLPLPYVDETLTVLNVTECIDVLDRDRTKFAAAATPGVRGEILHPVFRRERFTEASLFKIPDDNGAEIYVLEGANDFDMEFRLAVADAGLEGLTFTEIWSED